VASLKAPSALEEQMKTADTAPVGIALKSLRGPLEHVPSRTAASTGNFTVQVATYKNENFAQKEAMDFKLKGYQPFLIKKGGFWLVCVGKYGSMESAKGLFKKLPSQYRGSPIRRF
jgi:septal ring-binding cell division protein DamX